MDEALERSDAIMRPAGGFVDASPPECGKLPNMLLHAYHERRRRNAVGLRAAVVLLVLLAAASGCGKVEKGPERAAKSAAPGTVDAAGIKGIALPVEFPRDVPILRDATLKAAISQGDRIVVHLATSTSVADAAKFYDAELKSQGWKIESATKSTDMAVVSARKDRTQCGVTITREGKGALVRLSVSPARS